MPLAEIQDNCQTESSTDSGRMATIEISCSEHRKSASQPQSRCNSWRGRHSSGNTNTKHTGRRRSSSKLTRTNSASMPDCSSNGTNTIASVTTLGLRNSYSSGGYSYNNCPVCMVRSFKTTAKGDIVNTGSFCKVPSANSLRSSGSLNTSHCQSVAGDPASRRCSVERDRGGSIDSSSWCSVDENSHAGLQLPTEVPNICVTPSYFRTLVLGSGGVGKTSLVQQFTKAADPQYNDDEDCWRPGSGHIVSVELNGNESTMEFIDGSDVDLDLENYQVDAYILMYSVSEPASFGQAVSLLLYLRLDLGSDRPVYLVANKTDLVRQSRVAASEACRVASSHDCHFLETSTALNVNVDQLLVGVLCSIQRQLTPLAADYTSLSYSFHSCRKGSRGRRGSAGKDRRGSNASNNSGGAGKRKSLGLLGDDGGFGTFAAPPAAFSCLTPGFQAFSACRNSRSSSFSECSQHSKPSNSAFSAISNFIKQACRRESKRRDAHA